MVIITLEMLQQAELAVGIGENHFSMSRGSFDYKQKVSGKTRLKKISVTENEGKTTLLFEHPKTKEKLRLELTTEDNGRIKLAFAENADKPTVYNRFWISFPADPDEHIYGCGETYSKFDLKGEKVRIFVAEHQNAKRITHKIVREKFIGKRPDRVQSFGRYESYYAQPTFVSSGKYYVHADIDAFSIFDFSRGDRTTLYTQEPPVLYIENADSFEELSGKLAGLLGHQTVLPSWIYDGAILAIQEGCERIDEKIKRCEEAGTKICGIWSQDWCGCRKTGFGYQVMWNWAWDKELYHDLDKKIIEWKEKGIRFLGYINPFI